MLRTVISDRSMMLKIGANVVMELIKGLLTMRKWALVVQNIQPTTIFINYDGTELQFGDVTHITKEMEKETIKEVLHLPYRYSFIKHHAFKDQASLIKDRHSVGIIMLEILVGTELVMAAILESQVEDIVDDCYQYLDPATAKVLRYLILHEGVLDL